MMMMKSFVRSKMVVDYCHDNDYGSDFDDDDNDDYDCFIIMKMMNMIKSFVCSKMVVDSVSLNSWLHMWARMCQVQHDDDDDDDDDGHDDGHDDNSENFRIYNKDDQLLRSQGAAGIDDFPIWVQLIPRSSNTFMIYGRNVLR